jgi:hypothetical protein
MCERVYTCSSGLNARRGRGKGLAKEQAKHSPHSSLTAGRSPLFPRNRMVSRVEAAFKCWCGERGVLPILEMNEGENREGRTEGFYRRVRTGLAAAAPGAVGEASFSVERRRVRGQARKSLHGAGSGKESLREGCSAIKSDMRGMRFENLDAYSYTINKKRKITTRD